MRAEALPLLVDMSRQGDVELAHQAMGVVANLAEILENQSVMVSNGTLQHLKFVLKSESLEVQREACRALGNLSAEFAHTAELASGGAFPPLIAALYRYARGKRGGGELGY